MWDSLLLSHRAVCYGQDRRNSLGWDSLPSPSRPKPLRHVWLEKAACLSGESHRQSLAPREGSSRSVRTHPLAVFCGNIS